MAAAEWVAVVVLWVSLGLILYGYLGYPLTLAALPARPSGGRRHESPPGIAIVIAAFNEAHHIVATVRNKLAQAYPPELLDVIVVSDGSVDGTDDVVRAIGDPRVQLLRQEPRQGKTLALNLAVGSTGRPLVVFSDANSLYAPDAVAQLVRPFADPAVGYVTGRLVYRDPGDTAVGSGSGLYMRYESWIRRLESRVGSVVGVNGGIDAVRRELYTPMRADHLPDFVLPLRVVASGHRVRYCEEAVATEEALGRQADEYRMRVRVSLRALHALGEMRALLHPRHGLFAFQLLIHKVLRYLMVIPLTAALVSNLVLVHRAAYGWLMAGQVLCYGLALVGWWSGGRIRWKPVFVPFYFCLINAAAAHALYRYLRGERAVLWAPRKGA
jgi:cellulose synthase/poly-beta-1,6-N-acetylglucosamine synthase-like glycosyltransferase